MQSKTARTMQGSVNLANLGLLEFRLAWGLGAGHRRGADGGGDWVGAGAKPFKEPLRPLRLSVPL